MRVQPVALTFQQWVEYVFDRPLSDPAWYWSHDEDGEDLNWWQPDPTTLVDYLTRLFEEPAFLADRYTPEQLNQEWDLGGLTPVADPQAPHDAVLQDVVDIDHAKLDVLREALAVPSVACQESALHGLRHFTAYYPREVEDIVTDFLARHPGLRSELREYAAKARSGATL